MKTPGTTKAEPSAPKQRKFTARQHRTLSALESQRWISREEIDRIARASNGPNVIKALRKRLGDDAIETRLVSKIDRDGRRIRPGQYRLTDKGRETLRGMGFEGGAAHG